MAGIELEELKDFRSGSTTNEAIKIYEGLPDDDTRVKMVLDGQIKELLGIFEAAHNKIKLIYDRFDKQSVPPGVKLVNIQIQSLIFSLKIYSAMTGKPLVGGRKSRRRRSRNGSKKN